MLTILLSLIAGLALLIWSSDRFVAGAVGLSHHLHLSPLIIGVVVIGFGTSAPELFISGVSAWQGNSGLAIGNAVGSNIANIGLILGVTALLTPILVSKKTLRREFPLLFLATALAWLLLQDSVLSLLDAIILLVCLVLTLTYLVTTSNSEEIEPVSVEKSSLFTTTLWTLLGLVVLLISSKILVSASIDLAHMLGVSDVVIGLTIVAIGTSLPELAASVTGALKHHTDLAIGNVLGSNIFNTLGVISVPGFIHSYAIPEEILARDFPIMLGLTLLLLIFSLLTRNRKGMSRFSGAVFLLCFIIFQTHIYFQSIPNS